MVPVSSSSHGTNSTRSDTAFPLPCGLSVGWYGPEASPHQVSRASTQRCGARVAHPEGVREYVVARHARGRLVARLDAVAGVAVDAAVGERDVGRLQLQRRVAAAPGRRQVDVGEPQVGAGKGAQVVPVARLRRRGVGGKDDRGGCRAVGDQRAAVGDVDLCRYRQA